MAISYNSRSIFFSLVLFVTFILWIAGVFPHQLVLSKHSARKGEKISFDSLESLADYSQRAPTKSNRSLTTSQDLALTALSLSGGEIAYFEISEEFNRTLQGVDETDAVFVVSMQNLVYELSKSSNQRVRSGIVYSQNELDEFLVEGAGFEGKGGLMELPDSTNRVNLTVRFRSREANATETSFQTILRMPQEHGVVFKRPEVEGGAVVVFLGQNAERR